MGTSILNPTKIAPLQGHRPLCRGRGYKESESDAPVQLNSCCSDQQKSKKNITIAACEPLLVEVIHLPLTWKRFLKLAQRLSSGYYSLHFIAAGKGKEAIKIN